MANSDVETSDVWEICAEFVWELSVAAGLSSEETRELARDMAAKLSRKMLLVYREEEMHEGSR